MGQLVQRPAAFDGCDAEPASVPPLEHERYLHTDLVAAHELIVSGELLRAIEAAVGPLEA